MKSVAQGDGWLVSFGRTARSSMMDVSLLANCPLLIFMAAFNGWRLCGFDDEDVDMTAVAKPESRSQDYSSPAMVRSMMSANAAAAVIRTHFGIFKWI